MVTEAVKNSSRLKKKHVLIALVSLLIVGLVVTCVLVAIRIFTDSQTEIVKVSLLASSEGDLTESLRTAINVSGILQSCES